MTLPMNDDNKEISRPSFLSLGSTNPNYINLSRDGRIQNHLSATCTEVNRDNYQEPAWSTTFLALRYWIILFLSSSYPLPPCYEWWQWFIPIYKETPRPSPFSLRSTNPDVLSLYSERVVSRILYVVEIKNKTEEEMHVRNKRDTRYTQLSLPSFAWHLNIWRPLPLPPCFPQGLWDKKEEY